MAYLKLYLILKCYNLSGAIKSGLFMKTRFINYTHRIKRLENFCFFKEIFHA